jgi:2-oxoisovalerate dehydrogenase E1 component
LREKKQAQEGKISKLPEVRRRSEFRSQLEQGSCVLPARRQLSFSEVGLNPADVKLALDVGLATFLLHAESIVANFCGEAFYTIGPCGEELLSAVGLALRTEDAAAYHYRHLSTCLARELKAGKSMEQVILNRARGFCISTRDPVGGGHHCLLGGGSQDFLVTSTLASQATPAVGRAAGLRLAKHLRLRAPKLSGDAVSYVSVGDGSVNNAHFLSAINTSEYMQHRGFQCPVVFGISDNGLCISLRGYGWLPKFLDQRLGMPTFVADGSDMADIFKQSSAAIEHARSRGMPAAVVYRDISRRFGHAASDRQDAYLRPEEITAAEERNALAGACAVAVAEGITTYAELSQRFATLENMIEDAFYEAAAEPKASSRDAVIQFNSQPLMPKSDVIASIAAPKEDTQKGSPVIMRRAMTKCLDELLDSNPELVYIGEDVQHGGYYKITEGLHAKHGLRVADFPPDETSLLGTAVGYSQAGMLPIVEIPYAKYLDCGSDMFYEAAIMNWLSAGTRPCGMVIRLQGFDKGVFGGNFHTHNSLQIPPGIDVLCYSNGSDYAKGLRYAVAQAKVGRVVMFVDSTDLLNRRHVFGKDDAWMTPYPHDPKDIAGFDEVRKYGEGKNLLIVSYGNGVPTAIRAQKTLKDEHGIEEVVVLDAPCLSQLPQGLEEELPKFQAVVFADVCKLGQHPHAGFIVQLQQKGLLPSKWQSVAAAPTYNPLGTTLTFLNEQDIIEAALKIVQ